MMSLKRTILFTLALLVLIGTISCVSIATSSTTATITGGSTTSSDSKHSSSESSHAASSDSKHTSSESPASSESKHSSSESSHAASSDSKHTSSESPASSDSKHTESSDSKHSSSESSHAASSDSKHSSSESPASSDSKHTSSESPASSDSKHSSSESSHAASSDSKHTSSESPASSDSKQSSSESSSNSISTSSDSKTASSDSDFPFGSSSDSSNSDSKNDSSDSYSYSSESYSSDSYSYSSESYSSDSYSYSSESYSSESYSSESYSSESYSSESYSSESYSESSQSSTSYDGCIVYISTTSINPNTTCGQENDPCPNLYDAIQACKAQDKTVGMKFIFDQGTYLIPNDKIISIYNQQIVLQGSGNTTLTFNSTQPVIMIEEPVDANDDDFTSFQISNLTITDLNNNFIMVSTNISGVQINIDFVTFNGLHVPDNIIKILAVDSSITQITVTNSTFSGNTYTGNVTNPHGFIIFGKSAYLAFVSSTFSNNIGDASLVHLINGKGYAQYCTFNSNNVNAAIYSQNQTATSFTITDSTFDSNTGVNSVSNSYLIYSVSSTVSVSRNVFNQNNDIAALYVVDQYGSTSQDLSNEFFSNNITKNTASGGLIYGSAGSNLNSYSNNILSNELSGACFMAMESNTFYVSTNVYNGNSGIFVNAIQTSDLEIFSNNFADNTHFEFLTCVQTNATINLNNNSTINTLNNDKLITCGNECNINKDGCLAPKEISNSSEASKPKKDNKGKIAAAVICSLIGGGLIAGAVYYFAVYRKKTHHYTRINNSDF